MAEAESIRSMLERPINQLQALSQALFSALSSGHLPDPPIADLAACDASLAEATRLARIHLLKQKRIEQLMDEVHELDAQLVEIVETLASGQRELRAIIEEGDERIKLAEKAQKCGSWTSYSRSLLIFSHLVAIPYPELIAYATRLADYTSVPPNAPVDDKEPATVPYAFHPPYPATEIMQRGRLGLQEPIGPVGETRVVGDAKGTSVCILFRCIPHISTAAPFLEPSTQARPRPVQAPAHQPSRRQAALNMDIFDLDLNPELG